MVYPNLKFPKRTGRPFFYTNFVSTVDGKVQVLQNTPDYWPIGSRTDHQVLMELRAYADCLIHGKNLALEFGNITLNNLNKPSFKKMRTQLGKSPDLPYYVVTNHPKSLSELKDRKVHITSSNIKLLSKQLHQQSYKNVLVEGGPTLLGSFLEQKLLDEIFLTIAPKIFGNTNNKTLTLVEGHLFPKNSIKNLHLLSVKRLGSEIYLHYKLVG